VIFGHLYPVWLKFRGGKGVAALIGILLGYDLFLFFCFSITWILVSILFKYSSLSALVALLMNVILVIGFYELKITFIIITFLIIYKHKENIRRLFKGEESKIKLKKKNKFIFFKKIFLFDFVIFFIFRIHQGIKSNSCSYNSLISFDYLTIFFYNSR